MTLIGAPVRAALLEQRERTKRSSKAEIERFIEELESKIISLGSQICALEELRDHQRACVLALKHIGSPIHSLPVELLVEIFDLAAGDYPYIEFKDMYRVSQVCSDWRQIAHSTPRLWTRIPSLDLHRKGNVPDPMAALLARSAPLPVRISLGHNYGGINPGILEEVMKVSSRWGYLLVDTIGPTPLSLLRQLAQCRLDNLEEMDLGSIDATESTPPPAFIAPRLRKLSISNFTGEAPQIIMPWAQLTELTFECDCQDGSLEVLTQCTNLVKADITISEWSRPPQVGQDLIYCSQLQSLELWFMAENPLFFDYLSAPVLQELRLHLDLADLPTELHWAAAHFTAFQMRTPNLTRLEIHSSDAFTITSDDLVAALRSAPSLTHLKLGCYDDTVDNAFIRALHYEDGVPPLVPRLHNLVIKWTLVLMEDVLAGMIASRWWDDTELVPSLVARWTHLELQIQCNWDRPLWELREDYHLPPWPILQIFTYTYT
ncbi:F-box domain-containing protein [Mycena sanguinolenta]|uniref:F-box domain-containing protein n=1 Tax=Mycena sanguinolenta TaxID=230812 RepID=A0A8H6YFT3_9AGAR|nr:F-box domain-containing protein [Mycena sanguinolenta]